MKESGFSGTGALVGGAIVVHVKSSREMNKISNEVYSVEKNKFVSQSLSLSL